MKIVFLGTPDFALPSLKALLDSKHEIAAVVTQPDKPRGRGGELCPSHVKVFSKSRNIRVLQYEKLSKEGVFDLKAIAPDLMVTVAYGQLLSQEVIDIPRFGILNVHASLLPKYRGAAPIQWAVINGETRTGISVMRTELALDSGDVLLQRAVDIAKDETAGELFDRLSIIGAEALTEAISLVDSGCAEYVKQDGSLASYCKTIKKENARIDFGKEPHEIVNFVRGMNPNPTAFAEINGEIVKVYRAEAVALNTPDGIALSVLRGGGETVTADVKNGLIVTARGGAVRLCEIRFPNGKRMADTEYLKGHSIL